MPSLSDVCTLAAAPGCCPLPVQSTDWPCWLAGHSAQLQPRTAPQCGRAAPTLRAPLIQRCSELQPPLVRVRHTSSELIWGRRCDNRMGFSEVGADPLGPLPDGRQYALMRTRVRTTASVSWPALAHLQVRLISHRVLPALGVEEGGREEGGCLHRRGVSKGGGAQLCSRRVSTCLGFHLVRHWELAVLSTTHTVASDR